MNKQNNQWTFIGSNNFRGYKRSHIAVYGDKIAMENVERISKETPVLEKVELNFIRLEDRIQVFAGKDLIGNIFDEDQIKLFDNGHVEGVHIRFEEQTIIAAGNKEIKRMHPKLFLKRNDV